MTLKDYSENEAVRPREQDLVSTCPHLGQSIPTSLSKYFMADLFPILYDLAHVAEGDPYNLHDLAHVSWVDLYYADPAQPLNDGR